MLTAILVGTKFYDDIFYDNNLYSRVGGISNPELNFLERRFLYLSNFEIAVSPENYQNYVQNLVGHFHGKPAVPVARHARQPSTEPEEEFK